MTGSFAHYINAVKKVAIFLAVIILANVIMGNFTRIASADYRPSYRIPCQVSQEGNWKSVRIAKQFNSDQALVDDINNNGRFGHNWPALDLSSNTANIGPRNYGICDSQTILLARGGKVIAKNWDSCEGWRLKIEHGDGQYSLYLHLARESSLSLGSSYAEGVEAGIMGQPASSSCGYGTHLHFGVINQGGTTSVGPIENWYFKNPFLNSTNKSPRIGIVTESSKILKVKEGSLNAGWVDQFINVADFQFTGNRIGILTDDGVVRVKEGGLNADWVIEYSNVKKFQIIGDRIGVLTRDGILLVKEGGLSAGWVEEYRNVQDFQLEGNRIGMIINFNANESTGTLYVKEGALNAGWYNQYDNVVNFQLEGNRIGVLLKDKTLLVKEGTLNAGWVNEYGGVLKFQLTGNRIGILISGGILLVKEGALNAGWVNEYGGVDKFQLEGDRIGIRLSDGSLLVKEGPLNAGWVNEASGVESFLLENKRIAFRTNSNDLLVKEGSLYAVWVVEYSNVQKYLLIDSY
ncbi:MAG: hypothetical protein OHK0022_13000 [Roseiflexaceae bacterium]